MNRSVKLFVGAVVVGIVLGAVIGTLLGALSPGLIRMFLGDYASASPVQDGAALGLLNGGIFGFFGGVILVIGHAIMVRKGADRE